VQTASELKAIFQDGWSIPERVENYVRNVANGEFQDAGSLTAWRECLEAALAVDRPLAVLDVGTGPGVFACLYAQMGHRCTGLDFSDRMLCEARRRAADLNLDCSFVLGDAEEPPFAAGSFDVVSSRHILFNLPRPGLAVRRWAGLLKPGGKMIIIGDEPEHTPASKSRRQCRRDYRFRRGRQFSVPCGWHPTADYLKSVSQCPLFRHNAGIVRAVMEAAGLEQIQSLPTDAILAARRARQPAAVRRPFPGRRIYVLVGVKPAESRHEG
jgi:ubiquinone/menaquinone biosynthesis C-methylase UbiE